MDLADFEDSTISLGDLLKRQDQLEADAGEVLGFNIDECTHDLGALCQPVYSCLTCQRAEGSERAGVCAACSVRCHGDHELVELLQRRDFTCDCGTIRVGAEADCVLGKRYAQDANTGNRYDHNFDGTFCICGHKYDAEKEESDMYQCTVCEDWFHRTCMLPSGFSLSDDDWDAFICTACTKGPAAPVLGRWAGAPGRGMMIVEADGTVRGALAAATGKRRASASPEPPSKRAKLDDPPTSASSQAADVSAAPISASTSTEASSTEIKCTAPPLPSTPAAGPVLLEDGWRERWCRCPACLPLFDDLPFFLADDEPWQPAADPEAKRSLLELGTEALERLPREAVIEGLHRYNHMRDGLLEYLRPMAASGEPITQAAIEAFFAEQKGRTT